MHMFPRVLLQKRNSMVLRFRYDFMKSIKRPCFVSDGGDVNRDRSIHIERACPVEPVDAIKLVFIYCQLNIS